MGQRCSDADTVTFNNARVPVDNLVGGEENEMDECYEDFRFL